MSLPRRAGLALAATAWALGLLGAGFALQRRAPLFVNLGAGDAPFARGFRGGWERDGLGQAGETMFRWALDGSRLELPVSVLGGSPRARLRLARFAPGAAEVSLQAGGIERARWAQPSQGWRVLEVDLLGLRGPLVLTLRAQSKDPGGLGVALDWVEVRGAGRVLPARRLLPGLAAFLFGVPLLAGLFFRSIGAGIVAGAVVSAMAAAAIGTDRLGGLVAVSRAGLPTLIALTAAGLAARLLGRSPSDRVDRRAAVIPAVAVTGALLALAHPFYYYPDVDTHARYLAAARAEPRLLLDPSDYQARTGAWTRQVGGRRVAFPYSPAFHVLAWPAALVLGDERAVKCLAVAAVGLSLLLVHALAGRLGFGPRAALLAQALFVLLPVTVSRLSLALYPALLGQALELLLIVFLAGPSSLDRSQAWSLALLLAASQVAYTGSLLNLAVLVPLVAVLEAGRGSRERAARLFGSYLLTAVAVVAVLYLRFLPVLRRDVLPYVGAFPPAAAEDGGPIFAAARRLALFYDAVYPLLLVAGVRAVRASPGTARRVVLATLAAGVALLGLRYAVPVVFRDAKEVELLAAPVAALAAGGAAWLWRRGPLLRGAAVVALVAAAAWGAGRAALAYGDRFVAVGR